MFKEGVLREATVDFRECSDGKLEEVKWKQGKVVFSDSGTLQIKAKAKFDFSATSGSQPQILQISGMIALLFVLYSFSSSGAKISGPFAQSGTLTKSAKERNATFRVQQGDRVTEISCDACQEWINDLKAVAEKPQILQYAFQFVSFFLSFPFFLFLSFRVHTLGRLVEVPRPRSIDPTTRWEACSSGMILFFSLLLSISFSLSFLLDDLRSLAVARTSQARRRARRARRRTATTRRETTRPTRTRSRRQRPSSMFPETPVFFSLFLLSPNSVFAVSSYI
jgi:hypothetical protein